MRLRASLGAVLVLTIAVAACGGGDGDSSKSASTSTSTTSTTSGPSASTTPTTAPGQPEGTFDGITWKVDEKPDATGTCQTVQLSGGPTDFPGNGKKSCVPVPAKDSVGADPVELASGSDDGRPSFISGFSAPEIENLQVATANGPATVTRWPSGGFIAWSATPATTITFTVDAKPQSCAVEWTGARPTQKCTPPVPAPTN
jgi:hypothetical protein